MRPGAPRTRARDTDGEASQAVDRIGQWTKERGKSPRLYPGSLVWCAKKPGREFWNGNGVPQDYVQAHMRFNLSAAQDNENARKNRDLAAKIMTPADKSKAQAMAREWLETHHE